MSCHNTVSIFQVNLYLSYIPLKVIEFYSFNFMFLAKLNFLICFYIKLFIDLHLPIYAISIPFVIIKVFYLN